MFFHTTVLHLYLKWYLLYLSSHSLWCPEKCSQQWDQQKPRWDIFTHLQPGFECATSSFLFVAVTYSPAFDPEGSAKDFKFVLMEKENAPDKKETEKLVMNIDSGKQFIYSSTADTAGKCNYRQHRDENEHGIGSSTIYWLDFVSHQLPTPATRCWKRSTKSHLVLRKAELRENVE